MKLSITVITFSLLTTFVRKFCAYSPGASWSIEGAFAALKTDGSVATWGGTQYGGDSCVTQPDPESADDELVCVRDVSLSLSSGVSVIYSNYYAFAALKTDGSVVTWGYGIYGGDSSSVSSSLSKLHVLDPKLL